jgi:hypothetical protein
VIIVKSTESDEGGGGGVVGEMMVGSSRDILLHFINFVIRVQSMTIAQEANAAASSRHSKACRVRA